MVNNQTDGPMWTAIRAFHEDERGESAIQYVVIASLVSVFLVGAYAALGQAQSETYAAFSKAITDAMGVSSP